MSIGLLALVWVMQFYGHLEQPGGRNTNVWVELRLTDLLVAVCLCASTPSIFDSSVVLGLRFRFIFGWPVTGISPLAQRIKFPSGAGPHPATRASSYHPFSVCLLLGGCVELTIFTFRQRLVWRTISSSKFCPAERITARVMLVKQTFVHADFSICAPSYSGSPRPLHLDIGVSTGVPIHNSCNPLTSLGARTRRLCNRESLPEPKIFMCSMRCRGACLVRQG